MLGFDIGGANTKAVLLHLENGKVQRAKVAVEYFPVWKNPEHLSSVLLRLKRRLGAEELDGLGVTMTAELSDAYQTKREGVNHILTCVKEVFPNFPIHVLTTDAKLEPLHAAQNEPLKVAAANWAATGWLVSKRMRDCVVVDVGSTSTSIITVLNGEVSAQGKTDLEKLLCGELVYTGSLRTNVAAIVHSVPIKCGVASVASELFAQSADVQRVLGNISEGDYSCETADGRGKTTEESLARLARVVCADTEMLTKQEILSMAQNIYEAQVGQITEGLAKVYSHAKALASGKVPIVVTGIGKTFLAAKAAQKVRVDGIVDLGTLLQDEAVLATPAFGVALMVAEKLAGGNVAWM